MQDQLNFLKRLGYGLSNSESGLHIIPPFFQIIRIQNSKHNLNKNKKQWVRTKPIAQISIKNDKLDVFSLVKTEIRTSFLR